MTDTTEREKLAKLLCCLEDDCPDGYAEPIFAATKHGGDCTNECHTCSVCLAESYRKKADRILSAGYRLAPATEPPGHTDLMVTPESLDDYLAKNPPPTVAPATESDREMARHIMFNARRRMVMTGIVESAEEAIAESIAAVRQAERERAMLDFWREFRVVLNMDNEQREYSWHDLVDASQKVLRARKP